MTYSLFKSIYVDDIIFGAINEKLCKELSKIMKGEFEMTMMGELNYFLGLQIIRKKNETFINQGKYIKDILKRFNMSDAKIDTIGVPQPVLTKMNTVRA